MLEVSHTRKYHRDPVFIHSMDNLFIAKGSAGLNYSSDTGMGRQIDSITEWKKGIT